MKAKEIQDLINFIKESGMDEVNIETDQFKLEVKKLIQTTSSLACFITFALEVEHGSTNGIDKHFQRFVRGKGEVSITRSIKVDGGFRAVFVSKPKFFSYIINGVHGGAPFEYNRAFVVALDFFDFDVTKDMAGRLG